MILLQYVSDFQSKLLTACEASKSNLKSTQGKIKQNYDKNTKEQLFIWLSLVVSFMASFVLSFFPLDVLDEIWDLIESVSEDFLPSLKSGDKVLAFLPIPGWPLQARYFGPYTVEKKASDLNYTCIITTPDRRKQTQLCHINMLKECVDRDSSNVAPVNVISSVPPRQSEMNCGEVDFEEMNFHKTDSTCSKLHNSDIFKDLDKKLAHLDQTQRDELKTLSLE